MMTYDDVLMTFHLAAQAARTGHRTYLIVRPHTKMLIPHGATSYLIMRHLIPHSATSYSCCNLILAQITRHTQQQPNKCPRFDTYGTSSTVRAHSVGSGRSLYIEAIQIKSRLKCESDGVYLGIDQISSPHALLARTLVNRRKCYVIGFTIIT